VGLGIQRQAVDLPPRPAAALQVHDQLELHLAPAGGFAEDGADVEHAEAAHFEEVLEQLRAARPSRTCRGDAGELDDVVGDQAVAARDEFQGEFALADAGIAGDEHAHAQHVHQHAVQLDRSRPAGATARAAQQVDDVGRGHCGVENRATYPIFRRVRARSG
jgi:hypothetical protein